VSGARPAFALVLHTHMPYVEGFGTWPFGEEWLWESIASSYLPLLDVLDAHPGKVTLSLTPVLCDQLEAPGALGRCERFLRDVRPESHRRDIEALPEAAAVLERSAAAYAEAAGALARRDLLADLGRHATWTSSATHAVLPLLATDAGVVLQLATGIESHRARFGDWQGGFWLPECAHAAWLDPLLEEAGVHVTCVDLTDARPELRAPLRSEAGPLLAPLDRAIVELVWSPAGYPSRGAYLDTHNRTPMRHCAWSVDGSLYEPERAAAQVRADADDFVSHLERRDGLVVCAIDTELLGDWWREGVDWLRAVLERCAERGIEVLPLAAAAERVEAVPAGDLGVTSWGEGRDLRTWSGPNAGGLAWEQRSAELRALAPGAGAPGPRALRELLALQASDWAFLLTRATAGPYPRERFDGHRAAFDAALADPAMDAQLRNLAPRLG
jgi:1,4-alpha-glucan branching enzyme